MASSAGAGETDPNRCKQKTRRGTKGTFYAPPRKCHPQEVPLCPPGTWGQSKINTIVLVGSMHTIVAAVMTSVTEKINTTWFLHAEMAVSSRGPPATFPLSVSKSESTCISRGSRFKDHPASAFLLLFQYPEVMSTHKHAWGVGVHAIKDGFPKDWPVSLDLHAAPAAAPNTSVLVRVPLHPTSAQAWHGTQTS